MFTTEKVPTFNSADLFDWVVEARIDGKELPKTLLDEINGSLYFHKRDDIYTHLFEDDEFMDALDWNNEAHRVNA